MNGGSPLTTTIDLPEQEEHDERPDDRQRRPTRLMRRPRPRWRRTSRAVADTTASSRSAIEPRPRQVHGDVGDDAPGPGDRTTTRSATRIASAMLWVTRTIVVRARSQRRSSSRSKRSRVSASSALNGSSRSSTSGSSASARASATRWAVPPDSSAGRLAVTPGSRATSSASVGQALAPRSSGQPASSSG